MKKLLILLVLISFMTACSKEQIKPSIKSAEFGRSGLIVRSNYESDYMSLTLIIDTVNNPTVSKNIYVVTQTSGLFVVDRFFIENQLYYVRLNARTENDYLYSETIKLNN